MVSKGHICGWVYVLTVLTFSFCSGDWSHPDYWATPHVITVTGVLDVQSDGTKNVPIISEITTNSLVYAAVNTVRNVDVIVTGEW